MQRTPTSIFPLVCYFMAAIAICIELLPREAFAIFGGKPDGDAWFVTLPFAGTFLLLGAILHLVLYRRNPERFDVRAFRFAGIGMLSVLAGFFVLSIGLARFAGLPPALLKQRFETVKAWGGLLVLGGVLLLFGFLIAGLILWVRFHPANRMARKLAAGDVPGAIRIGEAHMRKGRDFTTCFNLVHAYALDGQPQKARELLAALERSEELPELYTQDAFHQALDDLRKSLGLDPRNANQLDCSTQTNSQNVHE